MKMPQYLILLTLLLSLGCAAVLISGAGGGVAYTVTNIAYKTVSQPIGDVQSAVHKALEKMSIKELYVLKTARGIEIDAETADLRIYIDLQWITNRTTKITVDARKNIIMKDKATATAIIEQAAIILNSSTGALTDAAGSKDISVIR